MKMLSSVETLIEGKWLFDGKTMHANEACKRIEWLVNHKLKELAVNGDAWESLYQDPNDGRYWLLSLVVRVATRREPAGQLAH